MKQQQNMISPSIDELTKGNPAAPADCNRYELVIGVAKATRMVNDEYLEEYNETDGNVSEEFRTKKVVRIALERLMPRKIGDYTDPSRYIMKRANG